MARLNKQPRRLYEFGPFRLDTSERVLLRDHRPVSLTPKAFKTLLVLVENHGHIVDKDELMNLVWDDTFVADITLVQNISTLRKALGDHYIETIPKRGYRFVSTVKELWEESAEPAPLERSGSILVIEEIEKTKVTDEAKPERRAEPETDSGQTSSIGEMSPAPGARRRLQWLSRPYRLAIFPALAIVIGAVAWYIAFHRAPRPPLSPLRIIPFASSPSGEEQPAFSHDGARMAFVKTDENGNPDIYIKLIRAGEPLRLTTNPELDYSPAWSPDGDHIAFIRYAPELSRDYVYVIPSLGGAERKVAELAPGISAQLSWAPDGEYLAVRDKDSPQEPFGIFLLSVESGVKRKITRPPENTVGDSRPAFSPDGQTLAFIRQSSSGGEDVYLVSIKGGEPRRLTFDNVLLHSLAWATDGREIVFSSSRVHTNFGLWRISASGGSPEWLSAAGLNVYYPSISRQGNRLAYTLSYMDPNISRVEVTGSQGQIGQRSVLISSTQLDAGPDYSPDGKKIAFTSGRSSNCPEIWVCDHDGSNPVQLTQMGAPDTGSPRWSPDGRFITFNANPEGHGDIYLISAEGGKPRRLTTESSRDLVPSWSRDGKWIYFASNRSGEWQVWKMPIAGAEAVQVTREGGFVAFESSDEQYVYYAKFRPEPEIWRARKDGGDEAPVPNLPQLARWSNWSVAKEGIYLISSNVKPAAIELYSFTTGRTKKIATIDGEAVDLNASPDGKWILYTQLNSNVRDIFLIENFHW